MRRRSASCVSLIFISVAALIVSTLAYRLRFLFGLLLEDGRRDAVFASELLSPARDREQNHTVVIPKIIHQTYKTEHIPEHWRAGQKAVKELHLDWEYKVFYLAPLFHLRAQKKGIKEYID
jgi:inositol phosphorylceramide mannosyltransferase catalytic subunit